MFYRRLSCYKKTSVSTIVVFEETKGSFAFNPTSLKMRLVFAYKLLPLELFWLKSEDMSVYEVVVFEKRQFQLTTKAK